MLQKRVSMEVEEIDNKNLCISCGACTIGKSNVTLKHNRRNNRLEPKGKYNDGNIESLCPGLGYDLPESDSFLGNYLYGLVGRTLNKEVAKNATSGGLITEFAGYCLRHNIVDEVITADFDANSLIGKQAIITEADDLIAVQGSKYTPVPMLSGLKKNTSRRLLIGTPCVIAAAKALVKKSALQEFEFYLTNFCGGYRYPIETKVLLRKLNLVEPLREFRYRSNGQPGELYARTESGRVATYPYPDYANLTATKKHLRCRLCVDATGELADISFGDAWLPKYLNSQYKWSIAIIRNDKAQSIITKMLNEKLIECEPIDEIEILSSQKGNINTKKIRQKSRISLYRLFGIYIPSFPSYSYSQKKGSIMFELKVELSRIIKPLLKK